MEDNLRHQIMVNTWLEGHTEQQLKKAILYLFKDRNREQILKRSDYLLSVMNVETEIQP